MIRRPPRSTLDRSSAASDVYKRQFQYRSSTGGTTANNNTTGFSAPYWVRLVRSGNSFAAYRSPDGVAWTQQGTATTIGMASTVYAGLAVTAHNNSTLCTAT